MGRISHELVQVMPDERTALMGDDATNGGLFMFVADKARDLSAGTLYVAKWHQKTAANGGSADLRSEEHTSELQSLMRISYAVFCLKKKTITTTKNQCTQ